VIKLLRWTLAVETDFYFFWRLKRFVSHLRHRHALHTKLYSPQMVIQIQQKNNKYIHALPCCIGSCAEDHLKRAQTVNPFAVLILISVVLFPVLHYHPEAVFDITRFFLYIFIYRYCLLIKKRSKVTICRYNYKVKKNKNHGVIHMCSTVKKIQVTRTSLTAENRVLAMCYSNHGRLKGLSGVKSSTKLNSSRIVRQTALRCLVQLTFRLIRR